MWRIAKTELNRGDPHWNEFVAALKQYPILWGIRFKQSGEGRLRDRALQELLPHYQKLEPTADVQRLRQRLSGIRASHRREWRKELKAQREGRTFKTSLWYYEQMRFLWSDRKKTYKWNETPKEEAASEEDSLEEEAMTEEEESPTPISLKAAKSVTEPETEALSLSKALSRVESLSQAESQTMPRLVPLQQSPAAASVPSSGPDEAAIYAASWATSYRRLDPIQQIYAKRAIDEVFALGMLNTLRWNSVEQEQQIMTAAAGDVYTIKLECEPEEHFIIS